MGYARHEAALMMNLLRHCGLNNHHGSAFECAFGNWFVTSWHFQVVRFLVSANFRRADSYVTNSMRLLATQRQIVVYSFLTTLQHNEGYAMINVSIPGLL